MLTRNSLCFINTIEMSECFPILPSLFKRSYTRSPKPLVSEWQVAGVSPPWQPELVLKQTRVSIRSEVSGWELPCCPPRILQLSWDGETRGHLCLSLLDLPMIFPPHPHTHLKCYVCKQLSAEEDCHGWGSEMGKIMQVPKYPIERSRTSTFASLESYPQRMVINLSLITGNCGSVAQRRNHRKINPT